MKLFLIATILMLSIGCVTAQKQNTSSLDKQRRGIASEVKDYNFDKKMMFNSKNIVIKFADEGWRQSASVSTGIIKSKKVIAISIHAEDNSNLSNRLKEQLIVLASNECRDLEEELFVEQSKSLINLDTAINKRSSQIPPSTLNTINDDRVFGRCHVEFESQKN